MTKQWAHGVRAEEGGDVTVTWYLETSIFMKRKKWEKSRSSSHFLVLPISKSKLVRYVGSQVLHTWSTTETSKAATTTYHLTATQARAGWLYLHKAKQLAECLTFKELAEVVFNWQTPCLARRTPQSSPQHLHWAQWCTSTAPAAGWRQDTYSKS